MIGIVGYTAKKQGKDIFLERSYASKTDTLLTHDFDTMVEWLTEDYPQSFHIAWDLSAFTDTIFSLLSVGERDKLKANPKLIVGNIKIFSTDRLLGITLTKPIKGNICERRENNFYGISHWMPATSDVPADTVEVEKYGEDILAGLRRMGIAPDKLTSPVGVFASELKQHKLPTVYSNEGILDASEYCTKMMGYEWRSAFKLGWFKEAHLYDMVSAYASLISLLPNTDKCKIQFSDHYIKSDWAIVKGEVEVWADISPIVYDTGDGYINPTGKWEGYFTKEEINWLIKRKLGSFKMIDGYFIDWLSPARPYRQPIYKLLAMRNGQDEMVNNLAKRMAQGVSGKLDQSNKDGSLGEFYNPILAAITRSRCRVALADFIYDHDLLDSVLTASVDGCLTTQPVSSISEKWRYEGISPALIAGKGEIWKPDKKPLNISYEDIMSAIKAHPNKEYYEVGDKSIDLVLASTDKDREYEGYPTTGGELLSNVYNSKPIKIISDAEKEKKQK